MTSSVGTVATGLLGLAGVGGLAALGTVLARRARPYLPGGLALVADGDRDPVGSALRFGCAGMEVGVRLDGEVLRLSGPAFAADSGATLERLVLAPLARLVKPTAHGRVYPERAETFLLLLSLDHTHEDRTVGDFAVQAYRALDHLLRDHVSMLTRYVDGRIGHGAVTVVLTGGRWPRALLVEAYERYAFIECGFEDVESVDLSDWLPPTVAPLVTESLAARVGWDPREGWAEFPAEARHIVRSLVLAGHAAGRQVRFVDVPDQPRRIRRMFWRELRAAGTDFIGSRRLAALARFLRRPPVGPAGRGRRYRAHSFHRVLDDSR